MSPYSAIPIVYRYSSDTGSHTVIAESSQPGYNWHCTAIFLQDIGLVRQTESWFHGQNWNEWHSSNAVLIDPPVNAEPNLRPYAFLLRQNYPNPVGAGVHNDRTTNIEYELPTRSFVVLKVYSIMGREIATLVNEVQPAGRHEVVFNAGSFPNCAAGIYLYSLITPETRIVRKMIILQ